MENWQPKKQNVETGELVMERDYGFGSPIMTYSHVSEGDTLYIRQENEGLNPMYVALNRYELYDLIFNFMSVDELVGLTNLKIDPNYEIEVVKK
jgi:hypothetical protein